MGPVLDGGAARSALKPVSVARSAGSARRRPTGPVASRGGAGGGSVRRMLAPGDVAGDDMLADVPCGPVCPVGVAA